jgi:hypothetical protein
MRLHEDPLRCAHDVSMAQPCLLCAFDQTGRFPTRTLRKMQPLTARQRADLFAHGELRFSGRNLSAANAALETLVTEGYNRDTLRVDVPDTWFGDTVLYVLPLHAD